MNARKNILIVGASGGIGKSISSNLSLLGHNVFKTDIENQSPNEIDSTIDVTKESSVKEVFELFLKKFKKLDLVVNCAGIGHFELLSDTSLDTWRKTLDTNLTGAFLISREAIITMRKTGGGRIIHIGSVSDHLTLPNNGAYGASKHGLRSLVGTINSEEHSHNIRTTLLSLGAVETPLWSKFPEFDPKRMLQPNDVAQIIENILNLPLRVRIDEIKALPPEGIL